MFRTPQTIYQERIEKTWTAEAREASAEARRGQGGAILSSRDAFKHFDITPRSLISRGKPLTAKSKIDGQYYTIHSLGYGSYKVTPYK